MPDVIRLNELRLSFPLSSRGGCGGLASVVRVFQIAAPSAALTRASWPFEAPLARPSCQRPQFLHELLGLEATTTANLRYQLLHRFFEFRSGNGLMTVAPTVTANGQRFLINRVVDDSGGEPLAMVINWPALVKR